MPTPIQGGRGRRAPNPSAVPAPAAAAQAVPVLADAAASSGAGAGRASMDAGVDVLEPARRSRTDLTAQATPRLQGHTPGARAAAPVRPALLTSGVELTGGGLLVDGRSTARDAGLSAATSRLLHRAAARVTTLDANPFAKLSAAQRKAAIAHLQPFLIAGRESGGRPRAVDVRGRAAAFALLHSVATSMTTKGEQPAARRLVDDLLAAAGSERHAGLQTQMRLGLLSLQAKGLTSSQIKRRKALVEELQPSAPPYAKWWGDDPAPKLNVKQYVQDEFWRREIANYRRHGFKIEVVNDTAGERHVIAHRVLEDPTGKHPPVAARVELVEQDADVFQAMADKDIHVVLYTGHSGVGSVAQWSLETAPEAQGEKLVGLFACRTKQNLDMVRRQYPGAHLLCSDRGTYGNDDRIAIMALFDGVARRAEYRDMHRAIETGDVWEKDNYWLPHDRRQLDHVDLDGDGRVARSGQRTDLLFDVDVARGRGERVTMKPMRAPPDPATTPGDKVVDGVSFFNSLHTYWSEEFGWDHEHAMADRFRADGWFKSDNPDEIVRVEEVKVSGQNPLYRVRVNVAYADQSRDALAMMMAWALNDHLSKETRPDESAYDRHLRGAAFVSSYVVNLVEYSDVGDQLLRSFAKRFGYPPSLNYGVAQKAVSSDYNFEASPKVLRGLERGMKYPFLEVNSERSSLAFRTYVAKALRLLRGSDSEVGRMTFEAVATGKVKVDELTDLEREDFHRLRREFLRDGVHLDPADFERLGDARTRAHRAITGSLHGYMWDDRIYVTTTQSPERLAETLVHEVNHILNRSEEHYRGDAAIFREEYRAYYAEALFRGDPVTDPAFARRLKERVIEDYGLKDVTPDDLPDVPPGRMLPAADERWGG